ncbi:MAG: hypothetical protein ABI134_18260, partial [Byssovorax sp.]
RVAARDLQVHRVVPEGLVVCPFLSFCGFLLSVIARLEGGRATKIEGHGLEAGHERLTRRIPHLA